MHIDITLPRYWWLMPLALLAMMSWHVTGSVAAVGGGEVEQQTAIEAEERLRVLRAQQAVRTHREQIVRAQMEALEAAPQGSISAEALRATRAELRRILTDAQEAEQQMLHSLRELWQAQGLATQASLYPQGVLTQFVWPVDPVQGISAGFHDAAYQKRFGLAHDAIDIPVLQGTVVRAVADGVVESAVDNGLGFNALVIRHAEGFSTLYGHVSAYLVQEGQEVAAGEAVALSGGTPGTVGAGKLTTGAHLHLEMRKDGQPVDPQEYLPARR